MPYGTTGAAAPTSLTFSFSTLPLRVVVKDGNPWFVAADVLTALTLDRKALERLDDDERGVSSIHTLGGTQQMGVVNESGLYSLILGSRKPEAKRFKKWVTSEVLPAIRKTGRYEHPAPIPTPAPTPAPITAGDQDLSMADMQTIRESIEAVSSYFRWHKAWRMGMWHHLRAATAVPSPHPFKVKHASIINAELWKMRMVAARMSNAFADAESKCIKAVLRGSLAESALIEVLDEIDHIPMPAQPALVL